MQVLRRSRFVSVAHKTVRANEFFMRRTGWVRFATAIAAAEMLLAGACHSGEVHPSFRADKCGPLLSAEQCTYPRQTDFKAHQYNLVSWPFVSRQTPDGRFAENRWKPVLAGEQPRPIAFNGQIMIRHATGGERSAPNYVARVWKNRDPNLSLGATIGYPHPGFPNVVVVPIGFQDVAAPGDEYEVQLFVSDPKAEIDDNALHTWWSGQ